MADSLRCCNTWLRYRGVVTSLPRLCNAIIEALVIKTTQYNHVFAGREKDLKNIELTLINN